ncbi:MAG: hypothetical protein ACRDR6_07320 [Pseudonocardiaceae bacterium]
MTQRPVLDLPREWEIRDELQRLVLADLLGPFGGDDEEFSGENPLTATRWAVLRPGVRCWSLISTKTSPPPTRAM